MTDGKKNEATVPVPAKGGDLDREKEEEDSKKRESRNIGPKRPQDDMEVAEEEDLTEEDRELKEKLELLVERAQDKDAGIQLQAINTIGDEVRSATSSMTSVPKPLKFLDPYYAVLQKAYDAVSTDSPNKVPFADVMSVLAMTMGDRSKRESLTYRLIAADCDLTKWGHSYLRSIILELRMAFDAIETEREEATDLESMEVETSAEAAPLLDLVHKIVPFLMTHNSEPEACDILLEVNELDKIERYVDKDNARRVCQYLLAAAEYYPEPENDDVRKAVLHIYRNTGGITDALRVAMLLKDNDTISELFKGCEDAAVKKQMAFMLADHAYNFTVAEDADEDADELNGLIGNVRLNEHFAILTKELDLENPKAPEDVYKTHLTDMPRVSLRGNADSAKQNLASTYVSGFVNLGSGKDKLMTTPSSDWVHKNKDHGKMSASASVGLLHLWDIDTAVAELDKFLYSESEHVKAGALLGAGIASARIRNEMDPALGLLTEYISGEPRDVRIASICGLGIAYCGRAHEDVQELLVPLIVDSDEAFEVQCFSAVSLGMVFAGTAQEDIIEAVMTALMSVDESKHDDPLMRMLCLALGLPFLGTSETCEMTLDALGVLPEKLRVLARTSVEVCAYAGTGSVVKVQQLLHQCGKHEKDDDGETPGTADQALACIGLAAIALREPLGSQMLVRMFDHLLQYGNLATRRALPLAVGLLYVSNPDLTCTDLLGKLSHDADEEISQNAILGLGICAAGTNNARVAQQLRQLAVYYAREANHSFLVKVAQGLMCMGKGLVTLSPVHSDGLLCCPTSMASLLVFLFAASSMKSTILSQYHIFLYHLVPAVVPRMLLTLDEDLNSVKIDVRVGTRVDTVAQAGRPRTITGFQTHATPVLVSHEERAELDSDEYLKLTSVLEQAVIVRKNPHYVPEEE